MGGDEFLLGAEDMANSWNWASAKWWKFDFHTHTPASDDFGKGSNQSEHKKNTCKEWLLNFMRSEVDCVAVTDHNSGAWIDPLKTALAELQSENNSEYRPLYLFPGVEISVQGNMHILAIFDCDKNTADVDSLLGAVKYRATKGKSDGCTESSAIEVINEIVKMGGIAIPAHVDQTNGLFTVFNGNTLEQIIDCSKIIAIEVIDSSLTKPTLYTSKKLNWSEILGTDSHHPSGSNGQRYPGSHFTWVKMSKPSLDGLRLALIDGDISIKRSDSSQGDPNVYHQMVIESIEVNDAKYLGRGQSFSCKLNPWLNTIIGGRGTGKSTTLEFLRTALKRNTEIPKNIENDFKKYSQTSHGRQDEGLLTGSTTFYVYFRKDGGRFRIKWSNDSKPHQIDEEISENNWKKTDGDITQRFPVRIYSQKQIFELAKHPHALLQVIDDASDVDFHNWKAMWDELTAKYLSICAQAREIQIGIQEESVIKGQLDDVKRKLEVFEKSGHSVILKDYQQRKNQLKAIQDWELKWADAGSNVRSIADQIVPDEMGSPDFTMETADEKELIEKSKEGVGANFQKIQTSLRAIADNLDVIREEWINKRGSLEISKNIEAATNKYNDLLATLSEGGAGDPSAYALLVSQKQNLEEKLRSFILKKGTLKQHQVNAENCLKEIYTHRNLITQKREIFLKKTLAGNTYVQITVIPYGNRSNVEENLRELLDRSTGGFEKDIGAVDGDEGILSLLANDQYQTLDKRIEAIKSTIFSIRANEETYISNVKDKRFVSHVQALSPEKMDRLHFWFPDDSLDVCYSLKDGENFKPVEQGSPGQKTAALLAFILSYGDEPLILDQPEDDLDNHLIYDLIVTQLRNIKQRRQILIVTHNANIVVNGDSENVIALDVKSGQTQIVAQGSLQETIIREEICRVMEGGKKAFDQRYHRINAGVLFSNQ